MKSMRMIALLLLISLTLAVPIVGAKRPDGQTMSAPGHAATAAAALDPRRIIVFLPQ